MDGWRKDTLKDILSLNYGKGLSAKQRVDGPHPVYGSNGIVGWHNKPLVHKRGIVVGRKGSAGEVHYSDSPFFAIDTTFYITEDDTDLDLSFLFYLLKHLNLKRILGDVGVPGLNREMAYRESVSYPVNKTEQQAIANVLVKLQDAVENQERIIQTATELKKALMQKLFTEGLRGEKQKRTEIGPMPESWHVISVKELGKIITGTTPPTRNKEHYENGEYDFVSPADIGETKYVYSSVKKISQSGLEVSRQLPKNAILAVCIGSTIGKVALTFKEASCTNQQINAIVCHDKMNPIFYYYALTYHRNRWSQLATPSPVPILSKGKFEKALICYPPFLDEQQEIAEMLSVVDRKYEQARRKMRVIQTLFKAILHQLMTGQIRVKDVSLRPQTEVVPA